MRVLFLTHRVPYAPNRGDRIRAYHMLRVLSGHADVHLVSLAHDETEANRSADLRDMARTVTVARVSVMRTYPAAALSLLTDRPLTHALLDSPAIGEAIAGVLRDHRPDVVLAYCSGMARFALEAPLHELPLVLDMVDVDSQKWASLGAARHTLKAWAYRREARCLSRFEAAAAGRARVTLVVNDREQTALRALAPAADIRVVPIGIDIAFYQPTVPPGEAPVVVFCGVMNYEPNAEAAVWLARHVWPRVRSRRPDARLTVVGSDPRDDIRALAARDASVTVTGRVDDVRPYLWGAALSVAPLFTARGVQNKVLEATAAGLPSVVTSQVFDGLPCEVRSACIVADDADSFATAILDLFDQSPHERRRRAQSADVQSLAWETKLAPLLPILQAASLPSRAH